MGWTPSTTTLGAASTASTPVQSTWKRLPGSILPIVKSSTSGIGANPAQASTSTYLSGAPRFVRSSQAISSLQADMEPSTVDTENDPDRSAKITIVSQGGGFDDLLSRLNQSKPKTATIGSTKTMSTLKQIDENGSNNQPFVVVIDPEAQPKTKSGRKKEKSSKAEKKKRVRILGLCSNQSSTASLESDLLEADQPKKKKSKKNTKRSEAELPKEKKSSRTSAKSKQRKSALLSPSLPTLEPKKLIHGDDDELVATSSGPIRISRPINPRVAARAKFINSKKLASSAGNTQAMAEILGIPPPA